MTLFLVSHAPRPSQRPTARAQGPVDLVVDGINLTARVGPGQASAFLRDLSLAAADLASGRRERAAVRHYQRDEAWEVSLERDGADVLVSVFRGGAEPEIAVHEHRARGERLVAALLAACEPAPPAAGERDGRADLAYARSLLAGLGPWAAGPALPPPVEVAIATAEGAPLRLFCRVPLRPRRGEATPGVERSDLASLLVRGPLWAEAHGRKAPAEDVLLVLAAERLAQLALDVLAHARRGAAFARHESVGGVPVGVRFEPGLGCRLAVGRPGRAPEPPPVPPEALAGAALEFGRGLARAILRHDRAQGSNLRLGAFRQALKRLGEALRPADAPAQARLNAAPESFRAYALAESAKQGAPGGAPAPAPARAAEGSPLGPGRLRYALRWEALVPGLDLHGTFLCGDRLVVSGRRETACLERAGGTVLWRRPAAPARGVPTPGGLARLYADGRVEVLDYGTGEVGLALALAPQRSGAPGGAVVNAPGLPKLLVVAEGERHLTAVDLVSGELRWRHARPRGGPCRLRRAGRLMLENAGDGTLTAIDVATGELVWRLCEREPIAGPPLFDQDTVYVASGDDDGGHLLLIDPWSGAVRRRVALPAPPEPGAAPLRTDASVALLVRGEGVVGVAGFARESGEPRFGPGPFAAPPGSAWLAVDATIFCNTEEGEAAGLRDADGSVLFRRRLGDGGAPPRRLEPVLRAGALFVPQADGVHLLRPRDGEGLGFAPTDLVPDLLRVDERCDLYVAEESGHLRAFGLGPRLAVVR
ncbi:MAG TPA: PQQ-binding-like beta-propeller repeat protein [Polyangiaceae bacterium]|nr:PQQ-binding-like beta-propeller repeat protein [Polyangiaceae bacterium]